VSEKWYRKATGTMMTRDLSACGDRQGKGKEKENAGREGDEQRATSQSTRNLSLKDPSCNPAGTQAAGTQAATQFIGPFKVTAQFNADAFLLELAPAYHRIHPVSNVDLLRPYAESVTAFPGHDDITRPHLHWP